MFYTTEDLIQLVVKRTPISMDDDYSWKIREAIIEAIELMEEFEPVPGQESLYQRKETHDGHDDGN